MSESEELDFLMEKMSSSLPTESWIDKKLSPSISPGQAEGPQNVTYPPNSPAITRNRRSVGLSSGSSLSLVSSSDNMPSFSKSRDISSKWKSGSASDLSVCSDLTPVIGRRAPPPPSPSLSRASSTMSIESNTGRQPVDSVLKHVRDRIHGHLFSGWYTERRYMEAIDRYRDVLIVDSTEAQIIKQVRYIIKKSIKIIGENSYVGVSFDEEECRMYLSNFKSLTSPVLSHENSHPFGRYWFQISAVNFIQNQGFLFEIKIIRPFLSSDSQTCWQCRLREQQAKNAPPVKIESINDALMDMRGRVSVLLSDFLLYLGDPSSWLEKARPHLTLTKLFGLCKFLVVILLALLAGLWAGLKHVANFVLRVIHELAFLVDRSTPLALGALNILSKVVGGFYLLIAMVWRDVRAKKPEAPPSQVPRALAPPAQRPPAITSTFTPSRQRRTPSKAHDTSLSDLSAMDNMYSEGRPW